MKKIDIRDLLFYLSLVTIIVWFAFKISGAFNTPLIVELIPIVSATFGAGIFYNKITYSLGRLTSLEKAFWAMKTNIIKIKTDVEHIQEKI